VPRQKRSRRSQRTGIINQIRAFLLERGVAVRQGLRFLRTELPGILATRSDVLSSRMMHVVEDLAGKKWLHHNVLAIALANKLARIAWAVLNKERNFECITTNATAPDMLERGAVLGPVKA